MPCSISLDEVNLVGAGRIELREMILSYGLFEQNCEYLQNGYHRSCKVLLLRYTEAVVT